MQTELRNESLIPVVLDVQLFFVSPKHFPCARPHLSNLGVLGLAYALTGEAGDSALL